MLTPNTVLQGRYCILRQIGGGGQALVYLAEDLNLGIRRAVKELTHDPNATPQERQAAYDQFQREARILAGLNHPNLVRVWDHFRVGDYAYLVMDYVDGRTLQEITDQSPDFLPEAAVLRWAGQLCNVLDYLHRQQPPIIFRDLKPSNVMLDQSDTIKLIDFGIVRHFKAGQTKDTVDMGTPGYAPLEQHGRGQTDARSDIHALGATLYHLLTRHEPEPAPARVLPGQPDPLQPARAYNPRVTPATEAALAKAMAVHPDQRFQSAREMKQALLSAPAVPTATVTVQPPATRRRIGLRWPVLVGLVALLVGLGWFLVGRGAPGGFGPRTMATPVGASLSATTVVLTSATSRPPGGIVPADTPASSPIVITAASNTPTAIPPAPSTTHPARVAVATTPTARPPAAYTPTPTETPLQTATPTLTSRPPATATRAPIPTATFTATPSPTRAPTPTRTPQVITDPGRLITFKLAIGEYRLTEKEALRTLDPTVVEQLATYAYGEALATITEHIEVLRTQGLYQELVVRQLEVQQVVLRDGQIAGALVQEKYTLRTYQPAADGDHLVDEEEFDGTIVYGLIYLDSRWKVERIRPVESTGRESSRKGRK